MRVCERFLITSRLAKPRIHEGWRSAVPPRNSWTSGHTELPARAVIRLWSPRREMLVRNERRKRIHHRESEKKSAAVQKQRPHRKAGRQARSPSSSLGGKEGPGLPAAAAKELQLQLAADCRVQGRARQSTPSRPCNLVPAHGPRGPSLPRRRRLLRLLQQRRTFLRMYP